MRQIGLQLIVDDSQKAKLQGISSAAQRAQSDINSRMTGPFSNAEYALNRLGTTAGIIAGVGFRALTGAVGSLAGAMRELGTEFIAVNEKFGNLQITLGSALRSFGAARDITKEIARLTAQSPLPFQDLAKIVQSLVVIPQTSQRLLQQVGAGKINDPQGYMQQAIRTVEAMNVFRPDQGAESAIFAIREALGGQLRSLIRRFDIPTRLMQTISRKSTKELVQDPDLMMKTLYKLFTDIISPEAVVAFARQPSTLRHNIIEQVEELPMLMVGSEDARTRASPYQAGLVRVQQIYDQLVEFIRGEFEQRFAPRLRTALTKTAEKLFSSSDQLISKALDSLGVAGEGAGIPRIVEGVVASFELLGKKLGELAEFIRDNDIIPKLITFVEGMLKFVGILAKAVQTISNVFSPTVAGAAVMLSPALLFNAGSILEFITGTVPRALSRLGGGVWSKISSRQEAIAEAIGGISPMGLALLQGGVLGGGRMATPIPGYLGTTDTAPQTLRKGEYRRAYREDFLAKGLDKLIDPEGTKSRGALYEAIERVRKKDAIFLAEDAERAKRLTSAVGGGKNLVGVSLAAKAEASQMAAILGATGAGAGAGAGTGFLAGAGRMLVGAGTGLLIGAVISGAGMLISKLIEALQANERATTRLVEVRTGKDTTAIDSVLSTSNRILAAISGVPIPSEEDILADPAYRAKRDASLLLGAFTRGKDGKLAPVEQATRYLRGAGGTAGLGELLRALPPEYREEMFKKYTLAEDTPYSTFFPQEAGVTYTSEQVTREFSLGEALNNPVASEEIIARLTKILNKLGSATVNAYIESFDAASVRAAEKVKVNGLDKSGIAFVLGQVAKDPFVEFVQKISEGTANAESPDDILSLLEQVSGEQALRAKAERTKTLRNMFFVSSTDETFSQEVMRASPEVYALRNLNRLKTEAESINKEYQTFSSEVFSAFESRAIQMEKLQLMIERASKAEDPRLQEIGRKLRMTVNSEAFRKAVEDKKVALSGVISAAVEDAGLTGILLETVTKNVILTARELQKNFTSLSKDEHAEQQDYLNQLFALDPSGKAKEMLGASSTIKALPSKGEVLDLDFSQALVDRTQQWADLWGRLLNDPAANAAFLAAVGREGEEAKADALAFVRNAYIAARKSLVDLVQNSATVFLSGLGKLDFTESSRLPVGLSSAQVSLARKAGFTDDEDVLRQERLFPKLQGRDRLSLLQKQLNLQNLLRDSEYFQKTTAEERATILERIVGLMEKQKDLQEDRVQDFGRGMKEGLITDPSELRKFAEEGVRAGQYIKDAFTDAFTSFVTNAKTAKEAFRDLVGGITEMLTRMMMQRAVSYFFNWILSMFGGPSSAAPVPTNTPSSYVQFQAEGGRIVGGSGRHDDVPAMLMGGEYVINRRAAQMIGYDTLDRMNDISSPVSRFASGGAVGVGTTPSLADAPTAGRAVNITITVNNNAQGGMSSEATSDDQSSFYRDLADSVDMLVEEKLQGHFRARGLFNPV